MSPDEFTTAYARGFPLTIRFLKRNGISIERAEDLAQEAWSRGWKNRDRLDRPECLATWANTVAMNLLRDELRTERIRTRVDLPEDFPILYPRIGDQVDGRILWQCIRKIDRRLIRANLAGLTHAELAALLGISVTACKIRILRAYSRARTRAEERTAARLQRFTTK